MQSSTVEHPVYVCVCVCVCVYVCIYIYICNIAKVRKSYSCNQFCLFFLISKLLALTKYSILARSTSSKNFQVATGA